MRIKISKRCLPYISNFIIKICALQYFLILTTDVINTDHDYGAMEHDYCAPIAQDKASELKKNPRFTN